MLNRKCKSRLVDSEHIPLLEGLREILQNLRASSLMAVKRARRATAKANDDAWAEAVATAEAEPAAEDDLDRGLIASSTDSDLAEPADVTDAEAVGSGFLASSTAESDVAEAAAAEATGTANRRSYVCPRCQRSFPWLGSLKRHLRSSVECGRLEVVTQHKPDKKGAARAAPQRRAQERSPAMSITEGAGVRCGHGGRARRRSQSNAAGARASVPARKRRSYSFPAGAGTGGSSKKAGAECYKCGIVFPDKSALLQHINTCHGYPTTPSRSPSQTCSSTSFSCSVSSRSGAPAARARARDAQEL